MEEGGAGVLDEMNGEPVGVIFREALDGGALGGVEGGSEGNEEVVRVAKKDRGGEHFRQVVFDLAEAAAGKKTDPDAVGVEVIFGGELLAGDGGLRQIGEGMADEFGIDAAGAVVRLFEGKDDEHAANVLADEADSVLLPGPELWADEVDDGNAEAVEFFGEAEVDFGEVDEDGDGGAAGADGALELAELAVDAGKMQDHFGQAHDGHVFSADDAIDAGGGHARAAHAPQLRCFGFWREAVGERRGEEGAVVLAAGFACRDEDGGGHRSARWVVAC